jgi:myosin heavy subunit
VTSQGIIYTRIGSIIIAVNPYKEQEDLYTEGNMQKYHQEQQGLSPHIYGKRA